MEMTPLERTLLTLAVAQKTAGPSKTPSARDIRRAHKEAEQAIEKRGVDVPKSQAVDKFVDKLCEGMSGISGMSGDECQGFWSSVKDAASKLIPVLPYVSPAGAIAVPLTRQYLASRAAKKAPAPAQDQGDLPDGTVAVVGTEYGHPEPGVTYLFGDDVVGAGGPEMSAAHRMRGGGGRANMGLKLAAAGLVPHTLYRAAVVKRANKLAAVRGGSTAKNMAIAAATVNRDMKKNGLKIFLPGAKPGRVTR